MVRIPQITVQLVLLLQDDFSGIDLTKSQSQFWVNGRRCHPIRKPEGFYVFTQLQGDEWQLTIQTPYYHPKTLFIQKAMLLPDRPVKVVRMLRQLQYSFGDCEILAGNGVPNSLLYGLCEEAPPLKLQEYKDGKVVIQGYTARPLLKRSFCIGTGKKREVFVITARDSNGGYQIDRQFRYRHGEGAPILRAYGTKCDKQGGYLLPIDFGMKDKLRTIESYNEEVGQWDCLLQTGRK